MDSNFDYFLLSEPHLHIFFPYNEIENRVQK